MNNEHGNIKVADDVIAVCAARAALETQGVYSQIRYQRAYSEKRLTQRV